VCLCLEKNKNERLPDVKNGLGPIFTPRGNSLLYFLWQEDRRGRFSHQQQEQSETPYKTQSLFGAITVMTNHFKTTKEILKQYKAYGIILRCKFCHEKIKEGEDVTVRPYTCSRQLDHVECVNQSRV